MIINISEISKDYDGKAVVGKVDVDANQEYSISASYDISFDRKDIRADVTDLVSNHIYSSSVFVHPRATCSSKPQPLHSCRTGGGFSGPFWSRQNHSLFVVASLQLCGSRAAFV